MQRDAGRPVGPPVSAAVGPPVSAKASAPVEGKRLVREASTLTKQVTQHSTPYCTQYHTRF